MEEKETADENQEEIGTVEIPPATGVFGQPWSMQKLLGLLAVFGPAAIVASVSIGAGETIVVVRTGAWARYDLLWLVLISLYRQRCFFLPICSDVTPPLLVNILDIVW